MILSNPWGLLALLSIPVILGLHFFRDRRKVLRIGGLHLWDFAKVSLPVGRKFDRLVRNLPLLFQILTALLLSLLIAGFDIPDRLQTRHQTVIIDDSASMLAGLKESAAARATRVLEGWAGPRDKYTIITAGARAQVLAGPFASRLEVLEAIRNWTPVAPASEMESAVNLAGKFASHASPVLFLTDSVENGNGYPDTLATYAVGKAAPNAALAFTERFRVGTKDRILVTLRGWSKDPIATTLRATADEHALFEQSVELSPGESKSFSFETEALDKALTIRIADDALNVDNLATLMPVSIKPVGVYIDASGETRSAVEKAVLAVPYTAISRDPATAQLVIGNPSTVSRPGPLRVFRIGIPGIDSVPTTSSASMTSGTMLAQGREIVVENRNGFFDTLPLEGILWPYESSVASPLSTVLMHGENPLMYESRRVDRQSEFVINLDVEKTNLFRQTAWPVIVQSIIEECRDAIPGLARSNYRTGEEINLNLSSLVSETGKYDLLRDGKPYLTYQELPSTLRDLPPGVYELNHGDKRLARFACNFYSPTESDLTSLNAKSFDLARLQPVTTNEATRNHWLYYGLTIMFITFTALAWAYHELSH